MDDLTRQAIELAETERKLRSTVRDTGIVTGIIDTTHVVVALATRSVTAVVPSSVGVLAEGSRVRVQVANSSVVESVLSSIAAGASWSGILASSPGTLTASQYTSLDLSTTSRSSGGLALTVSGHCWVVPETRPWALDIQAGWTSGSTSGNRLVGLWLNPAATSWASSSLPSSGQWLRARQIGAGTGLTHVDATWKGSLAAGDLVMPLLRTTSATGVLTSQWDTEWTIEAG